jgi:hypothetical protein
MTSRSNAPSLVSPCALAAPSREAKLAFECLDLGTGGIAEPLVKRIAGFDLAGVDQQRAGADKTRALVIVVSEQLELSGLKSRPLAFLRIAALEARDPLEYQLGDRGVLAHHYEHRGHLDPGALPAFELALVVAIEGVQCGFKHVGQIELTELAGAGGALGQRVWPLADMLPQVAIDDGIGLHQIVGHRHPRQFDDPALDRVHQTEVGHDPREERAFVVARTAQKEGGRRQIVNRAHAFRQFAAQRLDAVDPKPRGFGVFSGLFLFVAGQGAVGGASDLVPVAMMRLVIDDVDAVIVEELLASPPQHFRIGFRRFGRIGVVSWHEATRDLGHCLRLAVLKCVVVRDHYTLTL